MSEAIQPSQPIQASLIAAIERSSILMAEPDADLSLVVQKISGELRKIAWSGLACRILFRCALLEGTPNRARFVALVLSARGHTGAARFLADHAVSTGAKPWQKRRLAELKEASSPDDVTVSTRGRFSLEITDDGQVRVANGKHESLHPGASGERSLTDDERSESDAGWLSALLALLDGDPVGIHNDVLIIDVGSGQQALGTLRSVLPAIALLPVIPVLLARSLASVPGILDTLSSARTNCLSPVVAARTHSGHYGLITAGGGELLDAGPTHDLVLETIDDLVAVAAAVGLLDLYDSPVLRTQRAPVVDAFCSESTALLPLRNATRAFSPAMKYRGTPRATTQLRARLTDDLVAAAYFEEARSLLDTALPSERDRVRSALAARSVPSADHHNVESVESFAGPLFGGSGTYAFTVGEMPVDLRFDDRGYDTTVVFFHPAITKSVRRYPVFSGSTFSEHLQANRLFISDPSLYVDQRLRLAWYAGSKHQPTLQDELTTIISRFVRPGDRLIFFGASGGGFASLYYATKFPGSIAVPVNAQTTIGAYVPTIVNRYLGYAWDGLSIDQLPVCTDVRDLYRNPVANTVVYVQNTGDRDHMDNHFAPFMDALPQGHRISSLLVDAGEGHIPPPRDQLGRILDDVIRGA